MTPIKTAIATLSAVFVVGAIALIAPGGASAATTTDPVAAAAGWLSTQFEDGTHLPVPAGDHFDSYFSPSYFANYGENSDAIFGLAAAKAGAAKSAVALNYLVTNIDDYADLSAAFGGPFDGSVAKAAVAAEVAAVSGIAATNFGGHNLLQILKDDECAPVSPATTCTVPGTPPTTVPAGSPAGIYSSISASFAIIAEARGGGTYAPSANALSYLLSLQCSDGGFTSGTTACGLGAADVDSTSYAIMALQAAGGHTSALANAVAWLTAARNGAGYWVSQNVPNANSTGLAAAALDGQSVDVTTSRSWLAAQQIAAGSAGAGALKFAGGFTPTALTAGTSPSVLATAQGLTGLVDGGSLATLTAAGSATGTELLAATATAGTASVTAGATQTASGAGFAAGEQVSAVLNSTPVALGTVTAAADGTVALTFTVPAGLAVGSHTVTLTGATSGLTVTTAAFAVVALAAAVVVPAAGVDAALANTGLNGPTLGRLALLGAGALFAGFALLVGARRRRRST